MSNISIIGTGNMARTIGARAVAGGNTVEILAAISPRPPTWPRLSATAPRRENGAPPRPGTSSSWPCCTTVSCRSSPSTETLAGKVIVDISNPFNATFDGLAHREETSIAQEVAKAAR